MAVTATNTRPTTSQVHVPGSPCCWFVFMTDRRSRAALEMAAPGIAHPRRGQDWKDPCPDSAGAPGSSFLAAPCWRDPSHTASDGEGSTLRTSPDQGRLRSALVHRRRAGVRSVNGQIPVPSDALERNVGELGSRRQQRERATRAATREYPRQPVSWLCGISIVQLDNPCPHLLPHRATGAFEEDCFPIRPISRSGIKLAFVALWRG
jgi:hypothetical protein